jgi:hypothetical protein
MTGASMWIRRFVRGPDGRLVRYLWWTLLGVVGYVLFSVVVGTLWFAFGGSDI